MLEVLAQGEYPESTGRAGTTMYQLVGISCNPL